MNVLVDNSLVPLWVQGFLRVPGPPLVISTADCNVFRAAVSIKVKNPLFCLTPYYN